MTTMAGGTGAKTLLTLSLSSSSSSPFSLLSFPKFFPLPKGVLTSFTHKALYSTTTTATSAAAAVETANETLEPIKHSILLERLRHRHLKDSSKITATQQVKRLDSKLVRGRIEDGGENEGSKRNKKKNVALVESFAELGLSEEVMKALEEMGISVPTEIQCIGIPAVLDGKSVVLGSHTGSGKTLAYMLPLVQLLRRDEELHGKLMKPRRPRAVVLCPTRELCEQVFRVAKSVSHHARFRSTMISGGSRLRPQEDSLNIPIDMVVGTPGRVLQHIEDGNMVYGDIRYLVLDEADTMFDRGFGPDLRKFLAPLKNRASKAADQGFQTVLVSATMTKAVQNLVDEEFQGIEHLHTSTLHKKIASARHDFIKLSGSENKLEALLQVLEPSLAKGNRVMVFCNTLNSSRAVDHFLNENQISTVNYHGEVPAEERVANLKKFKSDDGDCPTLVCTDLAARGLDLEVDHVVMFDFPLNSVDYLHRTGRTARMGAKGKITSLVAKKNIALATRIEEAIMKNESVESVSVDSVKRDIARTRITEQKPRTAKSLKLSNSQSKVKVVMTKSSANRAKAVEAANNPGAKPGKAPTTFRSTKALKSGPASYSRVASSSGKAFKTSPASRFRPATFSVKGKAQSVPASRSRAATSSGKKINVVGFRGRSSSSSKKEILNVR